MKALKAKKELGQNFLKDTESIDLIVDSVDLQENDTVIEIGPGLGALTSKIASKLGTTGKLYAIEFDKRMIDGLTNRFKQNGNVQIIHTNVLDWLPEFRMQKTQEQTTYKIIGSLPYYITSPIIHKIIKKENQAMTCSLLVQKEVAQKISSIAPKGNYMSIFVQTFYEVQYMGTIDKTKFSPVPQVDGGVIKLTKKAATIPFEQIRKYEGFLHKGFANPRKMLNKVFSKEELKLIGVDGNLRPQNLTVNTWIKAFRALN